MRRYLGGGPGRLRRPEFGQLCSAQSDLDRGLVVRSQVFLGARAHVTVRERTPPPHVTGHCNKKRTQMKYSFRDKERHHVRKIMSGICKTKRKEKSLKEAYLFPVADSPVLSTGYISVARH